MNAKLEAISGQASATLSQLIRQASDEILVAWDGVVEEAHVQDTKPRLRLNFAITLDLDADKATYALAFGVRHRLEASATIPDPNQSELPIDTGA